LGENEDEAYGRGEPGHPAQDGVGLGHRGGASSGRRPGGPRGETGQV
jgi:hypothetical protein